MSNTYELAGRQGKCLKILPLLIRAGVRSTALEEAMHNEAFWGLLHAECKMSHTSDATRRMVLDKLREFELSPATEDA